jgi:hypothetical protein
VIKSIWAGLAAHVHKRDAYNAYSISIGKHERKKPCIDGRIVLEWLLGK